MKSASIIGIPLGATIAVHDDSPAFLGSKTDPAHFHFAFRTAESRRGLSCETGGVRGGWYEAGGRWFGWHWCDTSGLKQHAAFGDVSFAATVPVAAKATDNAFANAFVPPTPSYANAFVGPRGTGHWVRVVPDIGRTLGRTGHWVGLSAFRSDWPPVWCSLNCRVRLSTPNNYG